MTAIEKQGYAARQAARQLAVTTTEEKNWALEAIARALLRDAPVLLLDEATSALDVATERTILRNLAARYPHKTCIVTTHRPTVISLCCRVYQVSSGCLRLLDSDEAQRLAMDF